MYWQLLWILIFFRFIESVHLEELSVKFFKANVIPENYFQSLLITHSVKRAMECSHLCGRNHKCRAYLYCKDPVSVQGICHQYEDGESCVVESSVAQQYICSCYRKHVQYKNGICYSPIGYYGDHCQYVIEDCFQGMPYYNQKLRSFIQPVASGRPFEVFCDFQYGFTIIQQRRDDCIATDFNRTWIDYATGFGYSHAEHWLGLRKIKALTDLFPYKLDIIIARVGKPECVIIYENFGFKATPPYRFSGIKRNSGPNACSPIDDILINNTPFSTSDNDVYGGKCPHDYASGFWFLDKPNICSLGNLNGPRNIGQKTGASLTWFDMQNRVIYDVTRVTMRLIRM